MPLTRPALAIVLVGLIAAAPAAAAETTTLTFEEPEKGSTFAFVDSAPVSSGP